MSTPTPPAPRRARHLIDPANPPAPPSSRSLTNVQQWVMSVLAVTTIMHLSVGLVISAFFLDDSEVSARVGLSVIGAAFGVVAVAAGLAIHRRSPLSPWLLLGTLPGVVGLVLVLA